MNTLEIVNAAPPRDRLLTRRQLLQRGWTADLFQFLPLPDETRPNPHNIRGPSVRLYRLQTILDVEARESFGHAMEAAAKRKAAAGKARETKREKFLAGMVTVAPPELPALSRPELVRRTLEAAAVDYLLAEAESYRCSLMERFRGVDIDDRQWAIDQKILAAIAAAYPWLSTECRHRMANGQSGNARRAEGRY